MHTASDDVQDAVKAMRNGALGLSEGVVSHPLKQLGISQRQIRRAAEKSWA